MRGKRSSILHTFSRSASGNLVATQRSPAAGGAPGPRVAMYRYGKRVANLSDGCALRHGCGRSQNVCLCKFVRPPLACSGLANVIVRGSTRRRLRHGAMRTESESDSVSEHGIRRDGEEILTGCTRPRARASSFSTRPPAALYYRGHRLQSEAI